MTLKAETEDWLHTGKEKNKQKNTTTLIATKVSARWIGENTTQQGFQSNGRKNAHRSQEKTRTKRSLTKGKNEMYRTEIGEVEMIKVNWKTNQYEGSTEDSISQKKGSVILRKGHQKKFSMCNNDKGMEMREDSLRHTIKHARRRHRETEIQS